MHAKEACLGHQEPLWDFGEFAAVDQGCESGIGAEGVPLGIDRKEDQVDVAGFECSVEPLEHCVGVVEACVNQCSRIRRNVTLAGY